MKFTHRPRHHGRRRRSDDYFFLYFAEFIFSYVVCAWVRVSFAQMPRSNVFFSFHSFIFFNAPMIFLRFLIRCSSFFFLIFLICLRLKNSAFGHMYCEDWLKNREHCGIVNDEYVCEHMDRRSSTTIGGCCLMHQGEKNIIKRQSRRRHLRVDFVYAHFFFLSGIISLTNNTHIHMIDIFVTVTANVNYFHVFRKHTYKWRWKKRQMNETNAIQIRPT